MARGSSSIQPLGIGNIVSAGLRLYGAHLKQYLGIAFIATLWVLLPYVALIPPILLTIRLSSDSPLNAVLFWLVVGPLWVFLLIYCIAKSLTNAATISRLAFSELSEQPETVAMVRNQLRPLTWRFFRAQLFVNALLFAVNMGLSFIQLMVNGIAMVFRNEIVVALVSLVTQLTAMAFYLWFYARWSIPEQALAIEGTMSGADAVSRSWKLTEGSALQILSVLLVAFLVTLPFYAIAFVPIISILVPLVALFREPAASDLAMLGSTVFLGIGLAVLLLTAIGIFTIPFWQTVKTLIYFDLRNRREGADLQLRDRAS